MSTPPPAGRPGATHPGTNVRRPAGDGRATDRRGLIVGTAIDLIAREGLRALTHRALDTEAGLPSGSTSYYFRTKRALVEAIVDAITERSRTDFRAGGLPVTGADDIAAAVATWLDDLLAQRRNHLIARHMLITDLLGDPDLHSRLVASLFSIGTLANSSARSAPPIPIRPQPITSPSSRAWYSTDSPVRERNWPPGPGRAPSSWPGRYAHNCAPRSDRRRRVPLRQAAVSTNPEVGTPVPAVTTMFSRPST